jgi:uncharacterized protein YndB with AHSA1/START domain
VGKASEEVEVKADLAEVWDLYFDPQRWRSWVDEFRGVDSSEGYPETGGKLLWHTGPNGRGQVTEEVLEHEPRRLHKIRFSDPESEGELTTTFEISGEGAKVKQDLVYGLFKPGVLGPITDRFFIRPQIQISMRRSLERLKVEAEGD